MYNDNKVKPLLITLRKTSINVKSYDEQSKRIYLLIGEDDLLEKYNAIWDKVSTDIKRRI